MCFSFNDVGLRLRAYGDHTRLDRGIALHRSSSSRREVKGSDSYPTSKALNGRFLREVKSSNSTDFPSVNGLCFLGRDGSLTHHVLHASEFAIWIIAIIGRWCNSYGAMVAHRAGAQNFIVFACTTTCGAYSQLCHPLQGQPMYRTHACL